MLPVDPAQGSQALASGPMSLSIPEVGTFHGRTYEDSFVDSSRWEVERCNSLNLPQVSLLVTVVLTIVACGGCSSSPQDGSVAGGATKDNRPPTVRLVTIVPAPLTLAGPITAHVAADDPDGTDLPSDFSGS